MTFVHSKSSRVFLNELHVSGHMTGYTLKHSRSYSEVTTFLDDGCKYQPSHFGGSVELRGLFNSATGMHSEIDAARVAAADNSLLVTAMPEGYAQGSPAFIAVTDLTGYEVAAAVGESVTIAFEAMPDDGVDWGVVLHAHEAEAADANESSHDGAAATTNGGVASLHLTAYTGLTGAIVKVQHSVDDSAWADLVTFATATDVTSERALVAVGTTVRRYLRATVDVTGTGSATYAVAFARR